MTPQSALHNDEQPRESIELRAYRLWEERGRPWGTPEVDWFAAERELSADHAADSHEPPSVAAARVVGSVLGSVAGLVTSIVDSVQSGLESLER